ncbi:hypothetical protein P43SY_010731 [Pythium insidiosum]|uniref:DNA methyltransferase 1-associated 1 domain-containing protein n=1 Tax=Pythium insidiosum TaxID=114742 RepID=A0AAD5LYM4_PYTIN|nr:hypothetical protein P43SY_010731 [Pythium insidiosum]
MRSVESQLKKVAVKVDMKKKKELAETVFEMRRELPKGVFLRSATLALPQPKNGNGLSAKLFKKMELMLDEMGVPPRPMPTQLVCEAYDALRKDTLGLLSLRKHLAAKETEIQALKERYQTLTGKEFQSTVPPLPPRTTGPRSDANVANGAAASNSETGVQMQIGKVTWWLRLR